MISRKTKFRPLDAVILFFCIALGVYVVYRIKYGLEYNTNWSVIPQFLFHRDSETGNIVPNFLIAGFISTIKLSIWAVIFATIGGIIMGIFRIAWGKIISQYIEKVLIPRL